jgi:hypothetical protein
MAVSSSSRQRKPTGRQPTAARSSIPTVACLIVGVLGVFGALNSYQVSQGYSEQFPDAYGAARAELRFAPLVARTAPDAELGYFTDLDPSGAAYSAAYLAAQFALAPRLLRIIDSQTRDAQTRPEWAVGNFAQPRDYSQIGGAHGYGLVADLGNGVVLFHRKSQ